MEEETPPGGSDSSLEDGRWQIHQHYSKGEVAGLTARVRAPVAKTCYTRKGELLLELKGLLQKDGDIMGFTSWLHTALVIKAEVKRLQRNTELLILDIEESVSAEEIAQAVGAIGQVTTQKMRAGGLMAKVQVPIEKGIEVLKGGPLTIGWS